MTFRQGRLVLLVALVTLLWASSTSAKDVSLLSPHEIEDHLQNCSIIQDLNTNKLANAPTTTSFTTKLFAVLFPSKSPAINALLATAYISGPPNFLLALCPPNIDPSSLSIMVAFAVGGLLGDTLFHLLPEIFLGEDEPHKVKFIMLEPNRNLLLGVGIIIGLVTFMAMDKILRIATGGDSHKHAHDDSDLNFQEKEYTNGKVTGIDKNDQTNELRNRKTESKVIDLPIQPSQSTSPNPSIKLAGLLNLIADFTHNITDGLALSSSFYASPVLGATTTMAVFFHEIPHEVGDFALLIQSGFSKRKAMGAQFVTAVGAFLGTCIGILVQEYGSSSGDIKGEGEKGIQGIWGTSLQWGDMLLPFTAGTFLYVGTVAVIPELLETGPDKWMEFKRMIYQFGAMGVGAAIMLGISWS